MAIANYFGDNHNASENWVRLGYGKGVGEHLMEFVGERVPPV